jgi:hypothetical protein
MTFSCVVDGFSIRHSSLLHRLHHAPQLQLQLQFWPELPEHALRKGVVSPGGSMGSDFVIAVVCWSAALIAANFATAIALVRARERIRHLEQGGRPLQPGGSERLEQAVEAIALEVERISEGQRFTTKLLAERRGATPEVEPRRAPDPITTPH